MHQYLAHLGDFPVRAYGLVICLSIVCATGVAYFLAKADGRWHKHVPDMGIYCGLAGLAGARLWSVFFFDWGYYSEHLTEIPFVWQGGMAIQGGVVLGVLAGVVYTKRHGVDTWALGDIVAPAIILGQAIGRCANLLNGDAFGAPTGGDFGLLYPEGTLARQTYGLKPLWPAEVWEGQLDIIIFAFLLIFRTTRHAKGQVLALYAVLYSLARFCLEYLRGDYTKPFALGLPSAQFTSLVICLAGAAAFMYCGWRAGRKKKVKPRARTQRE
jgi:phosphatidylglycerol:prolipoprotein diacylglycerol transferase